MNISEIIRKEELDTPEMVFIVEEYINKRKGVRVNIDLFSNTEHIPSFARKHLLIHQFQLLDTAYQSAISYFFNEKY